jgi:hypothetical protein
MLATMAAAWGSSSGQRPAIGEGSDISSRRSTEGTDASSLRVRLGEERRGLAVLGEPEIRPTSRLALPGGLSGKRDEQFYECPQRRGSQSRRIFSQNLPNRGCPAVGPC